MQEGHEVSLYEFCYQSITFEPMLGVAPRLRDIPGLAGNSLLLDGNLQEVN